MIIGFLGKGGSGKSTVTSQVAHFLYTQGKNVLAIDADHNIDLTHNLAEGLPSFEYIGDAHDDLYDFLDIPLKEHYASFMNNSGLNYRFSLSPLDGFTRKYTFEIKERMRLMTAGPQTEEVLYGKACSHVLTTPLKLYLPLLELKENEVVVVDEKAGADGVTTGIVTGFDVAVIVCEPAFHSVKAAQQIADLLSFYDTPFTFVANKVTSPDDEFFIKQTLKINSLHVLPAAAKLSRNPNIQLAEWNNAITNLLKTCTDLNKNDRLVRSKKKFERNIAFINH